MSAVKAEAKTNDELIQNRNWLKELAQYCVPNPLRSVFELVITGIGFVGLWVAAWASLSISYWLTLAICIPAAGFLVRLFLIQHDCGHGALFRNRVLNDWVGRVLGIFSFTPYYVWRRSHALHHGRSGNLDKRGFGDIDTLTLREYEALPRLQRFGYRLYRHPLVLFAFGPAYNFLLRNRLPFEFMDAGKRYWISAMGTNIAIALVITVLIALIGPGPFFLVHLPILLLAASIGVWLFFVQHQFEDTYWAKDDEWALQDASFFGSSHYQLPLVLRWMTANIGVHHVHHLNSRIPYYRLQQVLRDFPELYAVRKLTLMQSFTCVKLALWDEGQKKLISFADAHQKNPATH